LIRNNSQVRRLTTKEQQHKLLWIMSHDWGACYWFVWSIAEWETWGKKSEQMLPFKDATVIQSMGDADTDCYVPGKDILIPPRTAITSQLLHQYSDMSAVQAFSSRPNLFFFYTYNPDWDGRETGVRFYLMDRRNWKSDNVQISNPAGETQCRHTSDPTFFYTTREEKEAKKRLTTAYLRAINSARFCAVPAGVVGWSFRLSDVIYSGCIPVIIGAEKTDYPFSKFIDYKAFALFVSPAAVLRGELEPRLLRVTAAEGHRMQSNMLKIRHHFVYGGPPSAKGSIDGPFELLLRSLERAKRAKVKARKQAEAVDPFE
jgi:hypothetical protein